jgi:hypothetical protein
MDSATLPPNSLHRLQRLARSRSPEERCDLCGVTIPHEHAHLLELASHQLRCACEACAVLFSDPNHPRFRRVSPRLTRLPELESADEALWDLLNVPINLAFFQRSSQADRVLALYPSPAGATESQLPPQAWDELTARCPTLRDMRPDIEALLLNHVGSRRDAFLVSIDECYRVVGLLRSNWRGLSGGREVWQALSRFFDELQRRATAGGARRA